MIDKISFKNYKLFKEKQTIELKPITILIGKNNSGKSAVLKLMTIIEGALKSQDTLPIKLLNDEVQSGNIFEDLVYGKFGRGLEIELFQKDEISGEDNSLQFEIAIDGDQNKPILDYWKLNDEIELRNIGDNNFENEIDQEKYRCEFLGVFLANYFYTKKQDSSGTVLNQPHTFNTDFIGSLREKTKLDYRLSSKLLVKSNPDGKYLYDFIIRDYQSTDKKYFTQISKWIKDKFEGWEIYIHAGKEPYHIEFRKGKLEINITETGMGIGQSLPLIARSYKPCDDETLIIVEEPEAHLHPYAHAQIAQLFAESTKFDKNKKYLIETHSQNFILRLRRLVAEGTIEEDSLRIYYVDFNEELNESNLTEIKVDGGGGVDWWPQNIFSETSIETRAIYNAQLNDLKNVD
jgi:predicted ATPase